MAPVSAPDDRRYRAVRRDVGLIRVRVGASGTRVRANSRLLRCRFTGHRRDYVDTTARRLQLQPSTPTAAGGAGPYGCYVLVPTIDPDWCLGPADGSFAGGGPLTVIVVARRVAAVVRALTGWRCIRPGTPPLSGGCGYDSGSEPDPAATPVLRTGSSSARRGSSTVPVGGPPC